MRNCFRQIPETLEAVYFVFRMFLVNICFNVKKLPVSYTHLSPEELEKVRCACERERDLAIVEFLYSSAVRVSELCQLNREDVSWQADDVLVLGKGNKEREVYLNARAHLHLRQYLESRNDNDPALFVSAKAPHQRLTCLLYTSRCV